MLIPTAGYSSNQQQLGLFIGDNALEDMGAVSLADELSWRLVLAADGNQQLISLPEGLLLDDGRNSEVVFAADGISIIEELLDGQLFISLKEEQVAPNRELSSGAEVVDPESATSDTTANEAAITSEDTQGTPSVVPEEDANTEQPQGALVVEEPADALGTMELPEGAVVIAVPCKIDQSKAVGVTLYLLFQSFQIIWSICNCW